ncbi:ABC transporter ATP-binding protein [Suicoccus acidiformans]|uniref:ABC transporter ATP-binding protein n=1 Tax=Suicoccus acidiformans TaxID=2036206 RepID=A0A347WL57_9LACT|nr:pyridoxamine 5'-phosphate oxidase family protein [Suicoccus acidiformans]AXY25814.1 ABC transporter ATP-binding protein [Suicoccus acidiformans]
MTYTDYLQILQDEIGASVFATVDKDGHPHSRIANVGVADENGIFFMTSPKTQFYAQLQDKPEVAITGMVNNDKGIQVIRVEGQVREIGKDRLEEILQDNPYVNDVYPDAEDQKSAQAFQVYKGKGTYQHLQKRVSEEFSFDLE